MGKKIIRRRVITIKKIKIMEEEENK